MVCFFFCFWFSCDNPSSSGRITSSMCINARSCSSSGFTEYSLPAPRGSSYYSLLFFQQVSNKIITYVQYVFKFIWIKTQFILSCFTVNTLFRYWQNEVSSQLFLGRSCGYVSSAVSAQSLSYDVWRVSLAVAIAALPSQPRVLLRLWNSNSIYTIKSKSSFIALQCLLSLIVLLRRNSLRFDL